jgi:hypothetical protein
MADQYINTDDPQQQPTIATLPVAATDDETRRRNEMNLFALMAAGGGGGGDDSNPEGGIGGFGDVFHSNSIAVQREELMNNEENENKNAELTNAAARLLFGDQHHPMMLPSNRDDSSSAIHAASSAADANTTSQQQQQQQYQQQRGGPSTAAAAGTSHNHNNISSSTGAPRMSSAAAAAGSLQHLDGNNGLADAPPMFCERLILPRPLFFGSSPLLPPQLLLSPPPPHSSSSHSQPPHHHHHHPLPNVQNAIDFFHAMRSVSTYQPVFSQREDRVMEYRKQQQQKRPKMVSRVSTAPPRLSPPSAIRPAVVFDTTAIPELNDEDDDNDDNNDCNIDQTDDGGEYLNDESEHSMLRMSLLHLPDETDVLPFFPNPIPTREISDQEKFSQWALMGSSSHHSGFGGNGGGSVGESSLRYNNNNNNSSSHRLGSGSLFLDGGGNGNGSDEDSMIEDEQKTKVGASDNINKALALLSLSEHGNNNNARHETAVSTELDLPGIFLSQVPPDGSKRPLTNLELTQGCAPLFAVDDPPLPHESDLGLHETREEQQKSAAQKRCHELIDQFVPPNVFGSIACPNVAMSPDDTKHVRNPKSSLPRVRSPDKPPKSSRSSRGGGGGTDHRRHHHGGGASSSSSSSLKKSVRYGWWNKPWDDENQCNTPAPAANAATSSTTLNDTAGSPQPDDKSANNSSSHNGTNNIDNSNNNDIGDQCADTTADDTDSLQLPPLHHSASAAPHMIHSPLEPTPEQLRRDNLPLSRLHAATSMIQTLPFLSDRSPSLRHLQIDTQAVAFPPIKEEIEPFFCSIAIYNVETVAGTSSKMPLLDLQRCGRVTEALSFDYAAQETVEARCRPALWPYGGEHIGTRCGIFPIPSNLNVANLYAVLIVRKVVGGGSMSGIAAADSDLDPYLKPGKTWTDVERFKASAERASAKNGQILIPFAFGVAPLLQVFGLDNPVVASSRAVQIPLFHFSSGERQIFNHIMYMLFPRYVYLLLSVTSIVF